LIAFRIGATGAPILARQLGDVLPRDLVELANYEMFIKLMIDGAQSKVFSAQTSIDKILKEDIRDCSD
jgi:hypothetical protein